MKPLYLVVLIVLLVSTACNRDTHPQDEGNSKILATVISSVKGTPRWMDEKKYPDLWAVTREVLREELAPDDLRNLPEHQAAMHYKYVARIMQVDEYALAIIGEAMNQSISRDADYFKAYSIDLKSKQKGKVGDKGFVVWKFEKWAYFDHSPIPDTVFRFDSCEGCEATNYLASFQFDQGSHGWKMRDWPDVHSNVLIGDEWIGDDDTYTTACLYAIRDFNNDGYSDIATYCRTRGAEKGWQPAAAVLYTVAKAGPQEQKLTGAAANDLRRKLCKDHFEKSLCAN
jgi:hypothetical protein